MSLRLSDWSKVQDVDVVDSPGYGVALLLGVADRGVSAKTGANLRPVLLTILAEITEAASPDGR